MRRITLATLAAAGIIAAIIQAQQPLPSLFGDLHWRNVGPARSGYVSAPIGVPGDPTTYYAGMPEGGVWKTTNGGVTWAPIFDAVGVPSVGAVAVASSDHNVVYVGTGNQSGWSFTAGKGVYKSTDAGKTWATVGLTSSQYIGALVVDPRNANTVLVAAQGGGGRGGGAGASGAAGGAASAGERGVYRTTDGARTWSRVLPVDGSSGATDLWMDYSDPQVVYATLSAGSPGTGVYKSIDGGVNWRIMGGGGFPASARISAFTVASGTHGKRLYAVAGPTGRGGAPAGTRGLYRSDDGGDTWIMGTTQLASAGGKIYADPQRPDIVYLMGTAVYRSTDAGAHVAAFWGAPSGADPRFLWIDPTNAKRMIAGVDQGAAISVDDGATFSPYYGIVNGQFYRVATDYDFPYHVCGPQQDSGTACVPSRTDFGEIRPGDWYAGGGFENGFLIADPLDKRYMYTQGWYHVLRRFDRMTSQVVVLYQPKNDDRFNGAPPLAFSTDGHTLYMGAQYVMASTDHGLTWSAISKDLLVSPSSGAPESGPPATGRAAAAPGGSIQAFAVSPVTPGVLWAGTSSGLIWVTKDNGKTWTHVTPPNLPPGAVNILDASHKDPGTAYAAILSRDAHPHLYRTTNFGAAWQEISSGLTDGEVMRVVREDAVDPNLLYAGSVNGAFVSLDRGDHWQSLQLNLPHTVVSDMTVKDNDLVISTYGRGFWILDNVAPLRQMRAAMASASSAPVFFYTPSPASRVRWDNTQDTPVPPEMKVGDNPLEGAVFDYYLAQRATGTMTLSITDKAGAVIREFTNIAPPPDTTMPNVPEYWLMKPLVLPVSAGHHRVAWDLRYPDPPTLNYSYYGNSIDYREYTLNWHALPGQTYVSTNVGPMVPPGAYTATLIVNGRKYAQPFTVVPDPRVNATQAGYDAQFHLQMRMMAGIKATYDGVNYIQKLRDAIAARGQDADAKAADAAVAALTTGPESLGTVHRDLTRRLNDQVVGDLAPPQNIIDGVNQPCAIIDKAFDVLRQQAPKIAALKLPTWAPPAAPACGR